MLKIMELSDANKFLFVAWRDRRTRGSSIENSDPIDTTVWSWSIFGSWYNFSASRIAFSFFGIQEHFVRFWKDWTWLDRFFIAVWMKGREIRTLSKHHHSPWLNWFANILSATWKAKYCFAVEVHCTKRIQTKRMHKNIFTFYFDQCDGFLSGSANRNSMIYIFVSVIEWRRILQLKNHPANIWSPDSDQWKSFLVWSFSLHMHIFGMYISSNCKCTARLWHT